tara:strand:+ start:622 stop:1158 length:537 start_codon:yes stop_codon:yes gene_type:complete
MSLSPIKKLRRMEKEIELLENKNSNHISLLNIENLRLKARLDKTIILELLIFIRQYNDFIKVNIIIPDFYPFKKPTVVIKNRKYMELLTNIDRRYLMILNNEYNFSKYRSKSFCLCCHSILCKQNWGPSSKIYSILEEIEKNYVTIKRIKEIILCEKVLKHKFKGNSLDFIRIVYSFL